MERSVEELSAYRLSKAKEDFYLASKSETEIQLNNAIEFMDMIEAYLKNKKII